VLSLGAVKREGWPVEAGYEIYIRQSVSNRPWKAVASLQQLELPQFLN
jgi:hypothetical protein